MDHIFSQCYEHFLTLFNDHVGKKIGNVHVHLAVAESYTDDLSLDHILADLVSRDVRIIVAFLTEREAVKVLCKARQVGLTSADHVWVLPSYSDPNWWQNNSSSLCSKVELMEALESTLFILPTKYPPINQANLVSLLLVVLLLWMKPCVIISSWQTTSPGKFREDLLSYTLNLFPNLTTSDFNHLLIHSNAISAYDAVWMIARAWESASGNSECQNVTSSPDLGKALKNISVSGLYLFV